jgi:hypothetical protein
MNPYALKAIVSLEKERSQAMDNLHRAKHNFSGLHSSQMNVRYGDNGETPQQIVDTYQKSYDDCNNAIMWLRVVGNVR